MHFSTTLLTTTLIATANIVHADWLDSSDIPTQCNSTCNPIVETSNRCESQFDDDDDQRDCVCSTANFDTLIPECEMCIRGSRGDGDEIRDLRRDCGLPSPSGSVVPSVDASLTMSMSMATGTIGSLSGGGTGNPTTGNSQPSPTGSNDSGAGLKVASVAAAGVMALGAALVAMF